MNGTDKGPALQEITLSGAVTETQRDQLFSQSKWWRRRGEGEMGRG